MKPRHRTKRILFQHYLGIILCLLIVGILVAAYIGWEAAKGLALPFIGLLLSFVYFVQKQKLEETKLLKELITEFNHRYDELNEPMNRILAGTYSEGPQQNAEEKPSRQKTELEVLNDYFNLCAEEYLFYDLGYIHQEVWQSWWNGMKIFAGNQHIRETWAEELHNRSYYGFPLPPASKAKE